MSIYRAPYQGILLKLGRCERLSLLMMKRCLMEIWGKKFWDNNNFFSDNISIEERR